MDMAHGHCVQLVIATVWSCIRNMVSWLSVTMAGTTKGLGFGTNSVVHVEVSGLRCHRNTSNAESDPDLWSYEAIFRVLTSLTNHETTPYLAHEKRYIVPYSPCGLLQRKKRHLHPCIFVLANQMRRCTVGWRYTREGQGNAHERRKISLCGSGFMCCNAAISDVEE